jgi:hypothetical protein
MPKSIWDVARRADQFFMEASPIHETMRRLSRILDDMRIPFAIAGAMAANAHGHKRTAADAGTLQINFARCGKPHRSTKATSDDGLLPDDDN